MSFLAGAMYCFYYTVCIRIRKEKNPENAPIRLIRPSGSGKFYPVLNSTAGRIPFFRPSGRKIRTNRTELPLLSCKTAPGGI